MGDAWYTCWWFLAIFHGWLLWWIGMYAATQRIQQQLGWWGVVVRPRMRILNEWDDVSWHTQKNAEEKKQIMWKKKTKLQQRGLGSVPKWNTPFHPWFSHIGVHQIAKSPLVYHVNFPCKLPFRVPFQPYSNTKSAPFDDLAVGELPGVFSLGVSAGPAVTLGHIINGKCGNEMGITMFDC